MKTYTHKNGNTYNVNINGNSVILTSDKSGVCPLYITLENFQKLQLSDPKELTYNDVKVGDYVRVRYRYGRHKIGTVIGVTAKNIVLDMDKKCHSNASTVNAEKYRIASINGVWLKD